MTDFEELYRRVSDILPTGKWIGDLWTLEPNLLAVFGDNLIHGRGFFPGLIDVACAYGEDKLHLLDAESEHRFIELDLTDSEDLFFSKKRNAPGVAPGWGFPYDVCRQVIVGRGTWVLLSDRDSERMCFLSPQLPTFSQLQAVWSMFRQRDT